jgi:hypothetical protein
MFKAATQDVENALKHMLGNVESEMIKKVEEVVGLINNGYSSLLVDQNIFRALSSSRDDVRDILSQVDQQFEQVLRPTRHEDTAAMDVDAEAPASIQVPGTSVKASDSGCEVLVPASAD